VEQALSQVETILVLVAAAVAQPARGVRAIALLALVVRAGLERRHLFPALL
jgi:hypothetical protein